MGLATAIDRAIGTLAPGVAVRRAESRLRLDLAHNMAGVHKSARTSRLTKWIMGGTSADDDNLDDSSTIRERAREAVRDSGLAKGIVKTVTANVIGTGIQVYSSLDREALGLDEEQAELIERQQERVWRRWKLNADIGRRLTFDRMQVQAIGEAVTSGDALAVIRRKQRSGVRYATALMMIDSARLDTPLGGYGSSAALANGTQQTAEDLKGRDIRGGVEIGADGEPVAYWIARAEKPGVSPRVYTRVPARDREGRPNVLHLYDQERPGQSKGMSWFSPVLEQFKQMDDYIEAELVGARVAACFSVFIKRMNAFDVAAGYEQEQDSEGRRLEALEPGAIEYLEPGEEIDGFEPNRPGTTFDAFLERLLRNTAAGFGLSYEQVAKDWRQMNYSAGRTVLLEARREFRMRQLWAAEGFVLPVWRLVQEEAWLRGELDIPDFYERMDLWTEARLGPPGWEWVDPLKEAKADQEAIKARLTTRSAVCARLGVNQEDVDRQLARETRAGRRLGVSYDEIGLSEKTLISGIFTINEGREFMGLPPVEWGNEPLRVGGGASESEIGGDGDAENED